MSKELANKWESQLRKGVLDFIMLLFLNKKEYYGYELIRDIKKAIEMEISEGTIYPLLNRMKKEGNIESKWVEMDGGVPRKYYTITENGKVALKDMEEGWGKINTSMDKLLDNK